MLFLVERVGLICISTASSQQEATALISNIMALFGGQKKVICLAIIYSFNVGRSFQILQKNE